MCECHRCPFTTPPTHPPQKSLFICPFPPHPCQEFQARRKVQNSPSLKSALPCITQGSRDKSRIRIWGRVGGRLTAGHLSFKKMSLPREAMSPLFHGVSRQSKQQDGNEPLSWLPGSSQSAPSDGYGRPAPSRSAGGGQSICQQTAGAA